MTDILLSVIIPVYNTKKDLRRCLESVINGSSISLKKDTETEQSFTADELEVILVNDGSTDGSGILCDDLSVQYENVIVIHKENGGIASARNIGMDKAHGKYFAFLDSDDYLKPGSISRWIRWIRQYESDMIRFGFCKITETGDLLEDRTLPYPPGVYTGKELKELKLDSIYYKQVLDYKTPRILSSCTNLYRSSFLKEHDLKFRSERELLREEYLFVTSCMQAAESVAVCDVSCYCYVQRRGSVTQHYIPNMLERSRKLMQEYQRLIPVPDKEQSFRMDNFYIDSMYACIVNECRENPDGRKAVCEIRSILADEHLQTALARARSRVSATKTKVIVLLMRHQMALAMYRLYRLTAGK
jgi:glycosyltransferase involved in cell wall biosynthesis